MDNLTRLLPRSRKSTHMNAPIRTPVASTTSKILSHHVFIVHRSPAPTPDEQQEERYIGSTCLSSQPPSTRSSKVRICESDHTFNRPYLDENVPRSEGAIFNSATSGGSEEQNLPQVQKYVSVQELNSPSEIKLIEDNVRQNDILKKLQQELETSDSEEECSSIVDGTDSKELL